MIGVSGSRNKLAKVEAGATHALLASDPEIAAKVRPIAPDGVDVVYDFVGQATFALGAAAIRDGGVVAAIGAASGQAVPHAEQLSSRGVRIGGGGTPQSVRGATVPIATAEPWDAVRADLFSDLVVVRYPFDAIARAHADMDARLLSGSPVLIAWQAVEKPLRGIHGRGRVLGCRAGPEALFGRMRPLWRRGARRGAEGSTNC